LFNILLTLWRLHSRNLLVTVITMNWHLQRWN